MKQGHLVLVLAAVLGACTGPRVELKTLATAPRPMTPRPAEQLKVFESRPDGAVAVYDIEAYGDTRAKLDAAIKLKAASLGCDGLLLLVRKQAVYADNNATTGQLNEHHVQAGSHVEQLCIVLPAPDAAPAAN
jgi:hypothetical protein